MQIENFINRNISGTIPVDDVFPPLQGGVFIDHKVVSIQFKAKKGNEYMRTFTNTENKSNKQLAASYVVYMIVGSYFKDCICQNKFEEKRMYLNYAELSVPKQIDLEDRVISQFEKMDKTFLEAIQNLKCKVSFLQKDKDMFITFQTGGFESLEYKVNEKGKVECLTFSESQKKKGGFAVYLEREV